MLRKGLIHLFFVAPLLLLGISVPGIPSDAGLSYQSTLYAGLRDLSLQQEMFFADSLRYAVSLDEIGEVGWRAPAPGREGIGEFHFVTAASDTTGYAIEGRYSGMPDVLCYVARGAAVPDLPAPTWWDGVEDRPDCTPGAPQQVPGGLSEAGLWGPWGWWAVLVVVFVSFGLVLMQLIMVPFSRRDSTKQAVDRFVEQLGPSRVWSVLWAVGFVLYAVLAPW